MKNNLTTIVKGCFSRSMFALKKHSPEILIVTGVIGVVSAGVMACMATTKLNPILDNAKKDIEEIHKNNENVNNSEDSHEQLSEDNKKELATVYIQTGVKIVKLYAPSVALGMMSLTCIVASHDILKNRNAALVTAYATVSKSFKDYRDRVKERFGEEAEKDIRYDVKAKEFDKTDVDSDGNEVVTKETLMTMGKTGDYARFFDSASREWNKSSEFNLMFLKSQEDFANAKLKAKGHVFLNEIFDALDIPRCKEGQYIGWVYDPNIEHKIDFGIYDMSKEANRRFVNSYENVVLLDFNVDGYILDKKGVF